ncbi:MAG: hypothetical protein MPK62_02265 [Alphaproteobacteria bacterium]|nr:hypothetical protein [Alphaproteobacteria bacterium]MDA8029959.1 hypothetical protein [Alphaproteobacteria bacterium]
MPSAIFDNIYVRTGDAAPKSGFYIYKGSPNKGELPQVPADGEKVITLEQGEAVPACRGRDGVYRLTITTE